MRRKSHPLENLVIALAAVLAGIVAYHAGLRWLARYRELHAAAPAAAVPAPRAEPAELAVAVERQPKGVSRSFVGVRSIPPMALSRTGRLVVPRKNPPAPKGQKER